MLDKKIQTALQEPYQRELFAKNVLNPVFGKLFSMQERPVEVSEKPTKSESAVIEKVLIYGTIQLEDGTEIFCYELNKVR